MYGALVAGSERGTTLADNTAAYCELGLAPLAARRRGPQVWGPRDLSTTVLGQRLSMPVMISPVGVQAVHPDGEVAVARAAAAHGVPVGLSCFASRSVADVCAVHPQTLVQLHWIGGRDQVAADAARARNAGAAALILTLDWSFSEGRDWGSPAIPERIDLRAALRFGPQCLARPRWLAGWVRSGALPTLRTPNLLDGEGCPRRFFDAYRTWRTSPLPTWEDVAWLAELWGGPLMLKGVVRVDDARRAVDAGVTAISVSNHGGNNLDGTPAPIRALPAIVAAVADRVEVVTDGGVRRGSDVVKALALGARAVLIGRATLWGLAANGQAGVENVLGILRNEIDATVRGLGHARVQDVSSADVVIPPGFTRVLGG